MKEIEVLGKPVYIALPDNEYQFYSFVNLVINNRENRHVVEQDTRQPNRIGPYNVSYVRNEVGEIFIRVDQPGQEKFIKMIIDQFTLLRTYWNRIAKAEQYPNSSRYDL